MRGGEQTDPGDSQQLEVQEHPHLIPFLLWHSRTVQLSGQGPERHSAALSG